MYFKCFAKVLLKSNDLLRHRICCVEWKPSNTLIIFLPIPDCRPLGVDADVMAGGLVDSDAGASLAWSPNIFTLAIRHS